METVVHAQDRTGQCAKEGSKTEKLFDKLMGLHGVVNQDSTPTENMGHIDRYMIAPSGKTFTVDIKGVKRYKRQANWQFDDACLELFNTGYKGSMPSHKGKGWLFGSKAHYIAFKQEYDEFLLFTRTELIEQLDTVWKENTDPDETKKYPSKVEDIHAYVPYYRRPNQSDGIVWVPYKDLKSSLKYLILNEEGITVKGI